MRLFVKINGTRAGASPTQGGANIEMGGGNEGQLIEYVRSFDPRSWSCLHIAEGPFTCNNVTVQHNDIGPCGSDIFQEWADGISVSCQNSWIHNNTINSPTVRTYPLQSYELKGGLYMKCLLSYRMAALCCSARRGLWLRITPSMPRRSVNLFFHRCQIFTIHCYRTRY